MLTYGIRYFPFSQEWGIEEHQVPKQYEYMHPKLWDLQEARKQLKKLKRLLKVKDKYQPEDDDED